MSKSNKRKRKQHLTCVPEQKHEVATNEHMQQSTSDDDDDDDDDKDLMAAATAWAEQQDSQDASPNTETKPQQDDSRKIYSLHITQLDYDASDYDVRNHFTSNGCIVTSVRLVYDRSVDDRKLFRGVAFVDVADEESYQNALKLNRSKLLGRTMNVRPTKTKTELANIVQRTKEKVKQKIQKYKEERDAVEVDATSRESKRRRKDGENASKRERNHNIHMRTTRKAHPERKVTKKERNRRAAILNQKRRSKGSK